MENGHSRVTKLTSDAGDRDSTAHLKLPFLVFTKTPQMPFKGVLNWLAFLEIVLLCIREAKPGHTQQIVGIILRGYKMTEGEMTRTPWQEGQQEGASGAPEEPSRSHCGVSGLGLPHPHLESTFGLH